MNLHQSFPYLLYLVISKEGCLGRDYLHIAEQAIWGGVDIIQLREKANTTEAFIDNARRLKEVTDKYNIPLIINDNLLVAEKARSAGLHVGNNDTPPIIIRQKPVFRNALIGYSIEHIDQLHNEQIAVADYLGISPVFRTPTKKDTVTEWGFEGIAKIRSLTNKPLVAIGNINNGNAQAIIKSGANAVAVVSAICSAANPEKAAFELKNQLLK